MHNKPSINLWQTEVRIGVLVMDLVKDDDGIMTLAGALVDLPGAFTTDGETVTFE